MHILSIKSPDNEGSKRKEQEWWPPDLQDAWDEVEPVTKSLDGLTKFWKSTGKSGDTLQPSTQLLKGFLFLYTNTRNIESPPLQSATSDSHTHNNTISLAYKVISCSCKVIGGPSNPSGPISCKQGCSIPDFSSPVSLHDGHCRHRERRVVLGWTFPFALPEPLTSILQPALGSRKLLCVILSSGFSLTWPMGWPARHLREFRVLLLHSLATGSWWPGCILFWGPELALSLSFFLCSDNCSLLLSF